MKMDSPLSRAICSLTRRRVGVFMRTAQHEDHACGDFEDRLTAGMVCWRRRGGAHDRRHTGGGDRVRRAAGARVADRGKPRCRYRLSRRRDRLRGGPRARDRPGSSGAGRPQPPSPSGLSEDGLRSRLPGSGTPHRLPVHLRLRRVAGPAPFGGDRTGGAGRCRRVFDGLATGGIGTATFYHADYVKPYWAPALVRVAQIGAHIFYRFPGDPASPDLLSPGVSPAAAAGSRETVFSAWGLATLTVVRGHDGELMVRAN